MNGWLIGLAVIGGLAAYVALTTSLWHAVVSRVRRGGGR